MRCITALIICIIISFSPCQGQSNIKFTNPLAEEIIQGNYEVGDYMPAQIINLPEPIVDHLVDKVAAAKLKEYLIEMQQFRTRNSGSDTLLTGSGIGAARDWAYKKFESFNQENGDRLIVSYLQFDRNICALRQHKNIVALLPGVGEEKEELVIIEAHFDSRCGDVCDIDCVAQGMEDNASGSALVLEMARVMSQLTFDRTILFMLTIGEEQGLIGAEAMARYCQFNSVPVRAVRRKSTRQDDRQAGYKYHER